MTPLKQKPEKTHMTYGQFETPNRFAPLANLKEIKRELTSGICNVKVQKKTARVAKYRGGADNNEDQSIFERGIAVAKKHGINVKADKPNRKEGDCLFEAVVSNINERNCFPEKLEKTIQEYREEFVSEMQIQFQQTAHYPGEQEHTKWNDAWEKQKQAFQYNVNEYNISDIVPTAMGHCVKKNILIFNVAQNNQDPAQVCKSTFFHENNTPSTEIPVIVVYNGGHYESMLPKTQEDIEKSVELTNKIISGNYDKNEYDSPPPKRRRDMTPAEKKDYDNQKRKEKRKNETKEQMEARLKKDKESKSEKTQNETKQQREERLKNMREKRAQAKNKDHPLLNWARRFNIDNLYTFDVVENYLGPLKVWSKGEKLEHDLHWQEIMVHRWISKMTDAYKKDQSIKTTNNSNYDENLGYLLDPMKRGYKTNGWTYFKDQCKKVNKKHWILELYALLEYPEVCREAAKEGKIPESTLNRISQERKKKKFDFEKPSFKGPVCTCFARKFFGETLQCCQTRMKKFKDPSQADSENEGSDIEDGDNVNVSVLKRTKNLQPKGPEEFLTNN